MSRWDERFIKREVTVEDTRTALILGAGIGGLAAGIALRRAGWDVRIYERRSSIHELGFGLLLAQNAISALSELGIAESVIGRTAPGAGVEVRQLNGRVIRRFNGQLLGPAVVALRRDLHEALLNAVGRDALRLDSEVVAVNNHQGHVTLRLANGKIDSGAVLIGADGVGSIVRKQLHPNETPPRPSGFSAVRGVAYGVSNLLAGLTGVAYLDDGIEAAATRASSDAVYWYMSLLSDEVPANASSVESILAKRLGGLDPAFQAIIAATSPDDARYDELFNRDPLPTWGAGHITLLGDAAHPVLPHTGQGAAQALEDAVALGLVLSPSKDVGEALRRYEKVRIQRTRKFIKLGPRIARVTTTRNGLIQAFRTFFIRAVPASVIRSAAARSWDPHRDLRQ